MGTLKTEIVDQFIINTVLINPIEKILNQLEKNEFRDCDIKWLDDKMNALIMFAGETLNIKVPVMVEKETLPFINGYILDYYTKRFTTLLEYFKTF
jgi:hypothetical protein